ncbi:MAG: GNAT family protein [Caldiserica bacterium]|nr:GNAT family protein [Caldisericota bacterium]
MYTGKITIKETDQSDLPNIMKLWNDGDVMFYVGFPKGLDVTLERLQKWLNWVNQDIFRRHYSIYAEDIGYCGETFYEVDPEHDLAVLDIKLLPEAHGHGIAAYALSYSIDQVFRNHLTTKAYVDPHPDNKKAWKLYAKLGFVSKPRPEYLPAGPTYLEITPDTFRSACRTTPSGSSGVAGES